LDKAIMSGRKIAVPDEIYERVQEIATAEGTTVEELTTKALERDLARRWLERVGREAQVRRGNMTDDEVEAVVERAVQESRARS
jgi:fructose-1,6-bisphosphatase/sedoheptulose 1,7-bisphosphatase-like protein